MYVQDPSARVVGFKVEPFSVKHAFQSPQAYWSGAGDMPPLSTCDKDNFVNPVKLQTVRLRLSLSCFFLGLIQFGPARQFGFAMNLCWFNAGLLLHAFTRFLLYFLCLVPHSSGLIHVLAVDSSSMPRRCSPQLPLRAWSIL